MFININKLFCLSLLLSFFFTHSYCQVENTWKQDSIVIDETQEVWYSLQNGVVKIGSINDWDIAFQVFLATAGIRVNEAKGLALYRAGTDTVKWASLDTTGWLIPANRLYNSDTSWTYGAFNAERNPSNLFDDGWGVYDQATRIVKGQRMFFLKNRDGTVKKIWIRYLDSYANKFYFRIANLDNTQTQDLVCDRSSFPNQLFAYFSISTYQFLPPREPPLRSWDLLFTHYPRGGSSPTKVAGVLSNVVLNRQRNFAPVGVLVAKEKPVDIEKASPSASTKYQTAINAIGENWKNYLPTPPPGKWKVEDSLVYFIKDYSGIVWKLIFTDFTDNPQSRYIFKKQRLTPASLFPFLNSWNPSLIVYPNPAQQGSKQYAFLRNIYFQNPVVISISTFEGKLIWQATIFPFDFPISLPFLPAGSYIISLVAENHDTISRKLIVTH